MLGLTKVLTCLSMFTIISACSLPSPTLVEQGIVRIEIKESNPIHITRVTAYREDAMTVVRGEAAFPMWKSFGIFSGHIDIDIAIPGNEVLQRRNVALVRTRIPKKRGRRAIFRSKFEFDFPKGTVANIAYHVGVN